MGLSAPAENMGQKDEAFRRRLFRKADTARAEVMLACARQHDPQGEGAHERCTYSYHKVRAIPAKGPDGEYECYMRIRPVWGCALKKLKKVAACFSGTAKRKEAGIL